PTSTLLTATFIASAYTIDLLSFPTRRSSDLGRKRLCVGCPRGNRQTEERRARRFFDLQRFPHAIRSAEPAGRRRADCMRKSLQIDRKSTRLNSSHVAISYAVFCLKKKKRQIS